MLCFPHKPVLTCSPEKKVKISHQMSDTCTLSGSDMVCMYPVICNYLVKVFCQPILIVINCELGIMFTNYLAPSNYFFTSKAHIL